MAYAGLPLIQYWHDSEAPDDVLALIDGVRLHNPGHPHRMFDIDSAAALIAEHLGLREEGSFRACRVPAMQSDYFRYCAIYVLGGMYLDVDYRCVGGLGALIPGTGQGRLFSTAYEAFVNGLFAFGSLRHPFLELTIEIATANIERRISENVYLVTGPPIFGCLWALRELGSFDALFDRIDELPDEVRSAVRRYCEVIGDYERVEAASVGVEAVSVTRCYEAGLTPAVPLGYKERGVSWSKVRGSIFAP